MTAIFYGRPTPPTRPHEFTPKCRRGCCWSPYPICARNYACTCHREVK